MEWAWALLSDWRVWIVLASVLAVRICFLLFLAPKCRVCGSREHMARESPGYFWCERCNKGTRARWQLCIFFSKKAR
jgi:hypothetical protein